MRLQRSLRAADNDRPAQESAADLALIRAQLEVSRYSSFDALWSKRPGQLVRACALVTLRQRP